MSVKSPRLMQLTTLHSRTDTRIFVKQCAATLSSEFPGSVYLVVADGLGNAQHLGTQIVDLGFLGKNRLQRFTRGFSRSVAQLRVIRPAILHFHDPELIFVGLIAKVLGAVVIYDVHEDLPRQILLKHWIPSYLRRAVASVTEIAEWFAARVFDAVVPATPKIGARFPAHKTVLVQNFPLHSDVEAVRTIDYQNRPPVFVYAGGISRLRGAVEMAEAISRVDSAWNAELELIGTFSPSSLEQDVVTGRAGRVRFREWMSREEMKVVMMRARAGLVLFHPIPNHVDAQPNKLFEYMAAGLPVIASDFPLWRQIIGETGCGLLVDPQKPDVIAQAMTWILENPEQAESMGDRGRKAVVERFNWTGEGARLSRLYRRLLRNRGSDDGRDREMPVTRETRGK